MNNDPCTRKQRLARVRNWNKFRLTGMRHTLSHIQFHGAPEVCTASERELLKVAEMAIETVLRRWDVNSYELGLTPNSFKGKQTQGDGDEAN